MTHPAIVRPFFEAVEQGLFRDAARLARRILHGGRSIIVCRESSIPPALRIELADAGLVVQRDFERFRGKEFAVRIFPDENLERLRHLTFDPDLGTYVLPSGKPCPICAEGHSRLVERDGTVHARANDARKTLCGLGLLPWQLTTAHPLTCRRCIARLVKSDSLVKRFLVP